jgi:hypothetical protein
MPAETAVFFRKGGEDLDLEVFGLQCLGLVVLSGSKTRSRFDTAAAPMN